MGFSKCAAPGCRSRPGEGLCFKYYPKDATQLKAWLHVVPVEVKCRKTALCEKHFKTADVVAGSAGKKIVSTAVPIYSHTPAQPAQPTQANPFTDITNINVSSLSTKKLIRVTPPSPSTPPPSRRMLSTSYTPTQSAQPAQANLFRDVTNTETNFTILDEATGELVIASPSTCHSLHSLHNQDTDNLSVGFLNHLDESTGMLCYSQDVPIPDEEIMGLDQVVTFLDSEIAALREENAVKDKIIAQQKKKIDRLASENSKISKQVVTIVKAKQRVEGKLNQFTSILSKRQIERLSRRSSRGLKWEIEELQEGLILKMKCGTSGYNAWVERYPILPAVRTLQEAVQFIRFDSGILHEVFDMLQCFADNLSDMEKDCQLVFDEMVIEEKPKYDLSLQKWVGNATLSAHSGVAKKALLFLLAGISRRWKISVAVEFTNTMSAEAKESKENATGLAYKKIIDTIITKAESVGLRVSNMTTDMGADNLAVWKICSVPSSRKSETSCTFPNPVRENSKVTILPDSVHLMKAVKKMLESNVTVALPPDVVEEVGLLSPIVDYRHIEDLYEYESGSELKVAFRLRPENIHCKKQFQTMNVGTTKAVLCHRTGVGLQLLAKETNDASYATTAWFIIFLNTFFTLATCRHRGLAISKHNESAYDKAINMIKKMEYIFTHMKVGDKGVYKPVQRGVRVLCRGLLGLIDYFLNERNYKYLMLGRFTSDCIENVFSVIRLSQKVPDASMFLQCLKVVTLAQFSQAVEGSSYDYESSSPMARIDFLEEARARAKQRAFERFQDSLEEIMNNPCREIVDSDFDSFGEWERGVIYDIAGSTIRAILKSNAVVCHVCVSSVKWVGAAPHPAAFITEMKEFVMLRSDDGTNAHQISVSDAVYKALLYAEVTFRLYRERTITFKSTDVQQYFVEQLMYVWNGSGIPECHAMGRKILETFLDMRIKVYSQLRREQARKDETPVRSSRSAAGHQAAEQMLVCSSKR